MRKINRTVKLPEGYTMQYALEESLLILANLNNNVTRFENEFGYVARHRRDYWRKEASKFLKKFPVVSDEIEHETPEIK